MSKKIAISIWNNRISPVMDSARQLIIIECNNGAEKTHYILDIPEYSRVRKAKYLQNLEIDLLICGAISKTLRRLLTASNITVIPFVRGSFRKVLKAYLNDNLDNDGFLLPGCHQNRSEMALKGYRHRNKQK